MNLFIIMGIQGCGKSTHGKMLAEKHGMDYISTGDILRKHIKMKTTLGTMYKEAYERGELANDDIVFKMVDMVLSTSCGTEGTILDGFPRNIPQMEWLENNYKVKKCIFIDVPKEVAIKRLCLRAREDDSKEAIKKRIEDFNEQTIPVINHYSKNEQVLKISGDWNIDETFSMIEKKMKKEILKD